ncbi:hypothetical protein C0991_010911 [Blastosporella zonata]|nr:hypothetical protein C0991_010911 [Blastosporella zonata]
MVQPIKFYDIPSTLPGKAWSVNLWKTRYSLNFKGLPFETIWTEYPDIAPLAKTMGFKPAIGSNPPHYTLPAIYDPNTSAALADSAAIAEYLDKAYPDTPRLFPSGSHALQYVFLDIFQEKLRPVWQFVLPASVLILNPASEEYFRRTREAKFGKTLEDVVPKGEDAVVEWTKVQAAFDDIHGWLEKGKSNGPYFLGQEPAFVDIAIASLILYLKKTWGEDSQLWKDVATWNGGRWSKLIQDFQKYEGIL